MASLRSSIAQTNYPELIRKQHLEGVIDPLKILKKLLCDVYARSTHQAEINAFLTYTKFDDVNSVREGLIVFNLAVTKKGIFNFRGNTCAVFRAIFREYPFLFNPDHQKDNSIFNKIYAECQNERAQIVRKSLVQTIKILHEGASSCAHKARSILIDYVLWNNEEFELVKQAFLKIKDYQALVQLKTTNVDQQTSILLTIEDLMKRGNQEEQVNSCKVYGQIKANKEEKVSHLFRLVFSDNLEIASAAFHSLCHVEPMTNEDIDRIVNSFSKILPRFVQGEVFLREICSDLNSIPLQRADVAEQVFSIVMDNLKVASVKSKRELLLFNLILFKFIRNPKYQDQILDAIFEYIGTNRCAYNDVKFLLKSFCQYYAPLANLVVKLLELLYSPYSLDSVKALASLMTDSQNKRIFRLLNYMKYSYDIAPQDSWMSKSGVYTRNESFLDENIISLIGDFDLSFEQSEKLCSIIIKNEKELLMRNRDLQYDQFTFFDLLNDIANQDFRDNLFQSLMKQMDEANKQRVAASCQYPSFFTSNQSASADESLLLAFKKLAKFKKITDAHRKEIFSILLPYIMMDDTHPEVNQSAYAVLLTMAARGVKQCYIDVLLQHGERKADRDNGFAQFFYFQFAYIPLSSEQVGFIFNALKKIIKSNKDKTMHGSICKLMIDIFVRNAPHIKNTFAISCDLLNALLSLAPSDISHYSFNQVIINLSPAQAIAFLSILKVEIDDKLATDALHSVQEKERLMQFYYLCEAELHNIIQGGIANAKAILAEPVALPQVSLAASAATAAHHP